ncbi:reverse transcriptase domain-containing protein [Tanacetum coccineum]
MGCDENRMSINLAAAVFVAVSILKALKTEDLSRKLEVNYVKFQFRGGLLDGYKYGNLPREGPKPFAVRPSTKLGQRLSKTWQSLKYPKNSSILSKPDRAHICTIITAISGHHPVGPATIIPGIHKANYEILEPLLRDRLRKQRNEYLRTELEYFSEDYNEEREMEPRPERTREATPPLRTRSHMGNRPSEAGAEENERREMNLPLLLEAHLERNENGQPLQSSLTSVHGGRQSSINIGGNLPPNSIINGQTQVSLSKLRLVIPSLWEPLSTLHKEGTYPKLYQTLMYLCTMGLRLFADPTGSVTPFVLWIEDYPLPDGLKMPSHVGSYDGKGDPDNFLHLFEGVIRMQKWLMLVAYHMFTYTLKDSARIWWNSQKAGSILNYKDLKAKFRSHFSQQKRFTKTHLAVHIIKQREGESVRAFTTRTRNLVEHLSTGLPSTYKGLMEKTYTWIEAREVATNGAPNDRRDNFERSRKSSKDNGRGQKIRDRFSPYRGPNHGLLSSLSKSPREILATEKVAKSFEQPPRMLGSRRPRDMSKYCYFHEDHGHDTNDC